MRVKISAYLDRSVIARKCNYGDRAVRRSKARHISLPAEHQLLLAMQSTDFYFDKIRACWAERLGVSEPQWNLLSALISMDEGEGVLIRDLSARLNVRPLLITSQTKELEKAGLLKCESSTNKTKHLMVRLTSRAQRKISNLSKDSKVMHELRCIEVDLTQRRSPSEVLSLLKICFGGDIVGWWKTREVPPSDADHLTAEAYPAAR